MAISPSRAKMGVCLGYLKLKDQQCITAIAVYARDADGQFVLEAQRSFDFADACTQFEFSIDDEGELFFFTSDQLFAFRYGEEVKTKK